ncbi:hypothetical protein [Halobacterium zhouii]|uniref:hypothetical protein n=1 Tax=Halobacterium zhouii TaxID=2902624 RepID=UPI001E3E6BC8|nr:hypothetical protein [Halobacterium zhouii]
MVTQHARQHPRLDAPSGERRIEVSEMSAEGVASYVDARGDETYIERRGGKTFLVTTE